ncbi:hypothetical protein MBANPS3_001279 [Mucor bainieri]
MRICAYSIAFASAVALLTTLTSAQTYVSPSPRQASSCAMLDAGKIHCFGGLAGDRIDDTLYTLDTTKVQSGYATHWEQLTDSINAEIFTAHPRVRSSVAVTSDKKNMIITGGAFGTTYYDNPALNMVYNSDTRRWRALPSFDDGVNGNDRHIYVHATSWVPDQSKLYNFGGLQITPPNDWYYDNVLKRNLTNVVFVEDNSTSKIGYYRMTTLDITANASTPWQVPRQRNPPVLSYYIQRSVYHPTSKKIFYIGGLVNNATTEALVATRNASMSEITTFDTVTGAWGTQNFTGDTIPSAREAHTVTLRTYWSHNFPSGQDILMYGGTQDNFYALADFCYTASLKTFEWTRCMNLTLPNNVPPARAEHSAVLDESKKILYILFGYQELETLMNTTNTVLAVNVTDPKQLNFIDTSQNLLTATEEPTPATGSKETATQTPNPDNDNSSILGGAVGGSLGGLLLIGIVAFFIWKKKRADKNKKIAKQRQDEEAEQLSVDWEAIEGNFITDSCPIPADEKDQRYSKPFDPSGLAENKQPLIMKNRSAGSTLASLPVPDSNANEVLSPDGANTGAVLIPDGANTGAVLNPDANEISIPDGANMGAVSIPDGANTEAVLNLDANEISIPDGGAQNGLKTKPDLHT